MRLDGTCDNLSGHMWLDIYFDKREAVEFELRVRSARSASNSDGVSISTWRFEPCDGARLLHVTSSQEQ